MQPPSAYLLASLFVILSAVTATPQCPPAGWETCSSAWPPPADGYCCSAAGWLGSTAAHCSNINALDECCSLNDEGRLTCVTECEEPPAVCTGDAAIDAVLLESKIGCKIGLIDSNEIAPRRYMIVKHASTAEAVPVEI